ncbi:hypothetical protein MMC32_003249 [Xylographa parallela]|nr:hypothetical protein [Xylographa parallela]
MVNSTTIAWAIPAKVNTVGAHVQAYVEHQIIVNASLGCITDGLQQYLPIGKLVPELAHEIVRHLGPPPSEKHVETWDALLACCEDHCWPTKDFSEEDREMFIRQWGDCRESMDIHEFEFQYSMHGEHSEKHYEAQQDMLRRIGKSTVTNDLEEDTFLRYNKVWTIDCNRLSRSANDHSDTGARFWVTSIFRSM